VVENKRFLKRILTIKIAGLIINIESTVPTVFITYTTNTQQVHEFVISEKH